MRDDIDPEKPPVKLDLTSLTTCTHPNGTVIPKGDHAGYRAVMKTGETREFLILQPGNISIYVTDHVESGNLIILHESGDS